MQKHSVELKGNAESRDHRRFVSKSGPIQMTHDRLVLKGWSREASDSGEKQVITN